MTPEILQFIAKKRNCWHVAKHILEVINICFNYLNRIPLQMILTLMANFNL